jgi:phosphoacetylglucosamine mutase
LRKRKVKKEQKKTMDGLEDNLTAFGESPKHLAYGTAGFRDRFDLPLDFVFARMGVLATLRTLSIGGKCVGAVITASHNLEPDNGIKLVDLSGGMLSRIWEPLAVSLANCKVSEFRALCSKIVENEGLDVSEAGKRGIVLVGRDTRPHSAKFRDCFQFGISLLGGVAADLGEVTTPMLHFSVRDMNSQSFSASDIAKFDASFWRGRYFRTIATGYVDLLRTQQERTDTPGTPGCSNSSIVLDTSFGVGSIAVDEFMQVYKELQQQQNALNSGASGASGANGDSSGASAAWPELLVDVRNRARAGMVNEGCGAEHAQKLQLPPVGVDANRDCGKLLCSFDGDADRIVFHAFLPNTNTGSRGGK